MGMDLDATREIGEAAMRSMQHHAVPSTPSNFAVWFHYHLGSVPTLKRTIDVLLANKRDVDEATSRDLFAMYIASTNAALGLGVRDQIDSVFAEAQRYLAGAIADNKQQIETLDGLTGCAVPDRDPRPLVEQLLAELSLSMQRAITLEANFAATASELNRVRQSFNEAEERSKIDELTGLANRRALQAFLHGLQIVAMEQGTPFSVLLLDIDHFKTFNDTYGHQTGDQVLRLVASVLKDHVRDGDLAARYGGEELMAVLSNAPLDAASQVAERIRASLALRTPRRRSTGEELSAVTVSIGVAQFWPGESMDALVARCDRALYLAKATGRNRVVTETVSEADTAA